MMLRHELQNISVEWKKDQVWKIKFKKNILINSLLIKTETCTFCEKGRCISVNFLFCTNF